MTTIYNVIQDRDGLSLSGLFTVWLVAIIGSLIVGISARDEAVQHKASTHEGALPADEPAKPLLGWVFVSLIVLFVAGQLGYEAWRYVVLQQMQSDYRSGSYEVVSGCVTGFSEQVGDHNVATDSFFVSGHPFIVDDSSWPIGFRQTAHHGSPLGPTSRAEIVVSHSGRILRVTVDPQGCLMRVWPPPTPEAR